MVYLSVDNSTLGLTAAAKPNEQTSWNRRWRIPMAIIIQTKTRWHHPLRIAANRVKKYLAWGGGIVLLVAIGYAIGHWK